MARLLDEFLDEHTVVAEAGEALALGRLEALADVGLRPCEPHPLAAAAGRGLHHHRIADLGGDPHRMFGIVDLADKAGDHVHAGRLGELLGLDLVAHRRDGIGRRPDERDPRLGARPREALAFGEEAIAGMDAVRPGLLRREQDQLGLEIALRRGRRPEPNRFVGHPHMRRARIGIRIDRDRGDPHLLGGAHHPARDLAAIGDQDLLEHQAPRALLSPP